MIQEPDKPHFLTCTVVEWLPVFTCPDAVQILLDSWTHQRANNPHAPSGTTKHENEGTDTKRDSTVRLLVPMLCVGMHTGRLCLSICESRSPYDPHACMYPTTEAEPLKTHSQAEPGNEKFSILSRFMSMAENETVLIIHFHVNIFPRSHALRGNEYRKALPSICESRSPYDPHTCMYPKAEAEPLRTHSQAEPGNERFSTLSRLMSMAKRGYVEIPEHRRYSSTRNYLGEPGLIGIDPWS